MNVTDAFDLETGWGPYAIERITYTHSRTGLSPSSATYQAMGCIHPGPPEMLQLMPEEERNRTFIVVYTDFALSVGSAVQSGPSFVAPDRISWNGQTWRVVRIRDWQMMGYTQALAVLMQEEELT